ncbi:MAG TPA: acetolactate decarboxylase [Conexibacter sp.]|nr:acetolactate decarboxylase [Conexibacter sp.]
MATAIDPRLIAALHPQTVRHGALGDERAAPHVVFQTSTLQALLDGAYDGDLTIGELRAHGDLGLGTFQALDGEMVVLDGEVWRARVDGSIVAVPDGELTPFAVVTPFAPEVTVAVERELGHDELLAFVNAHEPSPDVALAIRFDGRLAAVHARSVAPQRRPYRPLMEIAAELHDFMLPATDGALVGFRFPQGAEGVELPGFHLHAITDDRARGGHVLSAAVGPGVLRIETLTTLHMELPPGVELPAPPLDAAAARARAAALARLERDA